MTYFLKNLRVLFHKTYFALLRTVTKDLTKKAKLETANANNSSLQVTLFGRIDSQILKIFNLNENFF